MTQTNSIEINETMVHQFKTIIKESNQIVGKVIALANNEDSDCVAKLLFVTKCEIKGNDRFYLNGTMMEFSNENLSVIDICRSNYVQIVTMEELEKLNQNSQNINQFINGIYDRSIAEVIAELDKQSIERFTIALQNKYGNRYAEIKTISDKELIAWIDNICYVTENDGDCIVVMKVKTHLMDKETREYKIKKFVVPVNLLELIK